MHWWRGRDQANLVEIHAGSGQWTGPCPKDGRPRALHVKQGDNGGVIWAVPGCRGIHDREAAYPALLQRVLHAPNPSAAQHRVDPELDAFKDTMMMLAVNKALTPVALRLAVLEAAGIETDEALNVLGITDTGNRRRARLARDKALSPARTVKTDSKPRSGRACGASSKPDPPPAETRLPATTIKTDSLGLSKLTASAGHANGQKAPLTSDFTNLTEHASVVSGPAGTGTSTDTAVDLDLALELLRTNLGAEVIAAEIPEVWTASEEGNCRRCGTLCCRYGPRGSPLCADCQPITTAGRAAS